MRRVSGLQYSLSLDEQEKPPIADSRSDSLQVIAKQHRLRSVCLFSSAGIGELGIEKSGIEIACANEVVPYRIELYRENFPKHEIVEGDIWQVKDQIAAITANLLEQEELFLLYATPPCQGMSSNGMGRLKWEVSQGNRHEDDPRNRLIIPTVELIKKLQPRWVLLENVPGMRLTEIHDQNGDLVNIIDYISQQLGSEYFGAAEVIACDEFGIPQKRKRLVTIYTKDKNGKEHFKQNGGSFFSRDMKEGRKTLRDAIAHLPPLDAKNGKNQRLDFHKYHYVNVLNEIKYWWLENTPEGQTAFNNQCVNPSCRFQGNRLHIDQKKDGKWTSSKATPIECEKCGQPLPRPTVENAEGGKRLLKGFHSAYRRMKWDEPARTLTQNFLYEASDNKVHPEQNRVLSVLEALILQTIDRYDYRFTIAGKDIGPAKIAEVVGESVPPYLIEKICRMMIEVSYGKGSPK